MSTAYKAQRIEKLLTGGIAGNNTSGIARLSADKGGEILRAGGGAQHQMKRVKSGPLECVQYACGEYSALAAAFTDKCNFTGFKWLKRQRFEGTE